jgi:hypothetical protein
MVNNVYGSRGPPPFRSAEDQIQNLMSPAFRACPLLAGTED